MPNRYLLGLILFGVLILIRFFIMQNWHNSEILAEKAEGRVTKVINDKWGRQSLWLNNLLVKNHSKTQVGLGDLIIVVGSYEEEVINPFYREKWLKSRDIKIVQKYDEIPVIKRLRNSPFIEFEYRLKLLKEWAIKIFNLKFSLDSAGLMAGMVLGAGEVMSEELYQTMKDSGLAHLVVASGSNIALVGATILSGLSFLNKRHAILLAMLGVWSYAILAGMEAPVWRASIMLSLIWLAKILGRKTSGAWILAISCLFMLVIDPFILFSLSFQLSVAATAGLVFFSEPLQILAEHVGKSLSILGWFMGLAVQTLAAQIFILPLLLLYFGSTNMMSIFANIAVGILVTPLVLCGMFILLLSIILPELAQFISLPLELGLRYLHWVGNKTAGMEFASLNLTLNWWLAIIWWLVSLVFWWWLNKLTSFLENKQIAK